jgi:hypothetical protein
MQFAKSAVIVTLLTLPALPTLAEEFSDVALQLCEKVKSCAIAQMNQEEMTPEMRQMVQPMLDNMCVSVQSGVEEVPKDHALYPQGLACMRSLAQLSCEQIMEMEDSTTAECRKYEEMAGQAQAN